MKQSMKTVLPGLAFRNILRNRYRTLLSGSTIMLAALGICLLFALEQGMISDMETNVIHDVTGNIRVRTEMFSKNERIQPLQFFIPRTDDLIRHIEQLDGITGVEQRITVSASVYRADKIESVTLTGIPFTTTRLFSNRSTNFIEGNKSELNGPGRQAVITKTLSDALDLHKGDKFTFFMRTAAGGSNGATFTVAAVVHFGDTDFNTMRCFLDWKELSALLRMEGNAEELLVYTRKNMTASETAGTVRQIQLLGGTAAETRLEVLPWKQTGSIYALFDLIDTIYFFLAVVFFLLASTVIFNTTMMSVLERRKEIGTLVSLGMPRKDISLMVILEISMTAATAALIGILVAAGLIHLWHTSGFNMYTAGGSAVDGMNMSAWIYPSLSFRRFVMVFVTGVCIAVAACIGPARQALKVEPAEALRTET
jgi:putative ABC transport system permease protein